MTDAVLTPLALGIGLGFGAAVPPGPVNLEIARRTAAGGFRAGAAVGLGAVTVDVILAALLGVGVLAAVRDVAWLRVALGVGGVALLAWLGWISLRSFARRLRTRETTAAPAATRNGYATGLLLCATSPYQAAFWLGVPAAVGSIAGGAVWLCLGVFAATLAWVVTFASAGAWLARRLGWRLAAGMDLAGGVLLLGFAAASAFALGSALIH